MLTATTFVLNFTLVQPIYSLYLTTKGITIIQLGILLSVQSFIPLILRIPLSSLIERIGRIPSMIISLIISGIGTLLFIPAQGYTQLMLVIIFNSNIRQQLQPDRHEHRKRRSPTVPTRRRHGKIPHLPRTRHATGSRAMFMARWAPRLRLGYSGWQEPSQLSASSYWFSWLPRTSAREKKQRNQLSAHPSPCE